MNNPNPFVPQGSFLEQKNKARARLKIAVFFSISLSVMALMALLIQGCRKNDTTAEDQNTNATPDLGANTNTTPDTNTMANTLPPLSNAPVATPPPPPPPPPTPPAPPVVATEDYTVIKGDTLASIATKSNVKLKALEDANPGVNPKTLKIGQKIHLPVAAAPTTAAPTATTGAMDTTASAGGEQTYKVKSGDTLTSIAKHFHVTVKAIESANGLTTTSIKVGKTLKIPASAAAPAPAPAPEPAPAPAPAPVTTPPASLPPATSTNH
jgi:LysM repeat protein